MIIPKIAVGDILSLKKKHPCGSSDFEVLRVGSDIRIVCRGCGRDLTLPREKLEKAIRRIRHPQDAADAQENGGQTP